MKIINEAKKELKRIARKGKTNWSHRRENIGRNQERKREMSKRISVKKTRIKRKRKASKRTIWKYAKYFQKAKIENEGKKRKRRRRKLKRRRF